MTVALDLVKPERGIHSVCFVNRDDSFFPFLRNNGDFDSAFNNEENIFRAISLRKRQSARYYISRLSVLHQLW